MTEPGSERRVSVSETAARMGVSPQRVRTLCREGFFDTAHRLGRLGWWTIAEWEVTQATRLRDRPSYGDSERSTGNTETTET